ncbi:MAG: hypothetical protein H6983_22780 [Ectothiorhodospiraceae bacterium]|nr:hypothetical protein [Chromatiales bacterium]MCP5157021.1 hypothetical protein [Ectothiorhodospiraceae bacterium]
MAFRRLVELDFRVELGARRAVRVEARDDNGDSFTLVAVSGERRETVGALLRQVAQCYETTGQVDVSVDEATGLITGVISSA